MTAPLPPTAPPFQAHSLARRAWQRFKQRRLGYWSLLAFAALVLLSLLAEIISNDKPLLLKYEGQYYAPIFKTYPETTFGGDNLTDRKSVV